MSNPHHHTFKSLDSIQEYDHESDTSNIPTPPELSSVTLQPPSITELSVPFHSRSFSASISTPRSSVTRQPLATNQSIHSQLTAGQLSDPVQSTTDDATISKLSAISAGYYEDPYCHHIVRYPTRRSPLINRGYYSRVAAMRKVISVFLNSIPAEIPIVQVVNLGAGLDTTYFWVADFWASPKAIFYEIDFLEVLSKKVALFTRKEALWTRLQQIEGCRTVAEIDIDLQNEVHIRINDTLNFIPVDMKDIGAMQSLLNKAGFDSGRPTLYMSECSLIYLPASYSDQLIEWAANATTAESAFVLYEQINPYDQFGRTMVKNLELRGSPLLGIHDYPSLEDQQRRFLEFGWDRVTIEDMNRIYDHFLDKFELVRIQQLELFDELEEWRLIQQHYFVAVAVKGPFTQGQDQTTDARRLNYLNELSTIWDPNCEVRQEMPRFTTAELKSSFNSTQGGSCSVGERQGGPLLAPLLVASGSHPKLSPGPLSPLMCPEGSSSLLSSPIPPLAPMRKWSLAHSPSDNNLQEFLYGDLSPTTARANKR